MSDSFIQWNGNRMQGDTNTNKLGFPGLVKMAATVRNGVYTSTVGFSAGQTDAFGRIRVSQPETIFDSKQLLDNNPLLWDDQEVSGSGTSSTHSVNEAASTMGVSLNTAGKRVRQTFRRFNYQPGKSQQIFLTGNLQKSGGGTDITASMGYGDDNNGIFLVNKEGVPNWRLRSKVTGSVVDEDIPVGTAEGVSTAATGAQIRIIDSFDGDGPSGITLNITKSLILGIDFEWLSVGIVRYCLVFDGQIFPAAHIENAGYLNGAYMSTPNLPVCVWIENGGSGAASTISQICATVISEGGANPIGLPQYESNAASDTAAVEVSANTADAWYAVVGLRLKAAAVLSGGGEIKFSGASMIAETADDFEWCINHNPTVTGTFTYGDKANSAMQVARGDAATVTGGHKIVGGFSRAEGGGGRLAIASSLSLGAAINGTPDEVVFCVRPLSANANMQGGVNWTEL